MTSGKSEVSCLLKGSGFNPPLFRSFFVHHSFGSKHEQLISITVRNLASIKSAVILQMGGWILRNGWIIKSSSKVENDLRSFRQCWLIFRQQVQNEMRDCHLNETNKKVRIDKLTHFFQSTHSWPST